MTGYGQAQWSDDRVRIAVEVRAVNNRFIKIMPRTPEGLTCLEPAIEKRIREHLGRGTVNVNLTVEPQGSAARAPLNTAVLAAYWKDLAEVGRDLGIEGPPALDAVLLLPGVVGEEATVLVGIAHLAERVDQVVAEALGRLDAMRAAEGQATAQDLAATLQDMERRLAAVQRLAPKVVADYHQRLVVRVEMLLAGTPLAAEDPVLAKEVALFAERCDINEELARLASHIAQFREQLSAPGPAGARPGEGGPCPSGAGRRLEFLAQEMHREITTIGSKANDADISREVVEIKVAVDRLREQSQNIE
jgi:uncharacterized protein (TIGR00255 family)